MLTTYVRVMDEYRRKIRMELLNARESDRRDPADVLTWTRYRETAEGLRERSEREPRRGDHGGGS